MRGRSFPRCPICVEPISIREIDVQPSVVVIVEKGQSASLSLDDGPFVVDAAPHVGAVQPGLLGHVYKLDGRRCGVRYCGFYEGRISPFPEWGRENVCQCAAEHEQR